MNIKEQIIELRKNGDTYKNIVSKLGCSYDYVKQVSKESDLKVGHACFSDDEWAERVESHWDGKREFIRITRQSDDTWMLVRCKNCGTIREIHSATLRKNKPKTYVCSGCIRIRDAQERKSKSEKTAQQKLVRRFEKGKQCSLRFCKCGQLVTSKNGLLCPKCRQDNERSANITDAIITFKQLIY